MQKYHLKLFYNEIKSMLPSLFVWKYFVHSIAAQANLYFSHQNSSKAGLMRENSPQLPRYVSVSHTGKKTFTFFLFTSLTKSLLSGLLESPSCSLISAFSLKYSCFSRQFSPSRLQPNTSHHLLIHCPRHSSHHGPPQCPWNCASEKPLKPMFLT